MPTIVTTPVQMGSGIADATTIESDLKFIINQTVGGNFICQEASLDLISSSILANALVAANNLSELVDKAAARLNLEVHNLNYFAETTAPATALGNVGDFAFNDNFEWYEKTDSTTWTLRVNAVTAAELTAAIAAHAGASDPHPTYLTQAEAALLYAPLGESPGSGARYNYNASTTLASTTIGEIRLNTGTLSSVTSIAIHEQDRNNGPMGTILDTIGIGTKLQIAFDSSEETYGWYNVTAITDNGLYRTYTVTALASGSGTIAAGEVTLGIFGAASSASGGTTGLQYTYLSTAGTPAAGQIRSANIGIAGTISISATDGQSQSTADVLARIKIGAIVDIAKDATNRVRGTVTADYVAGTNSFDVSSLFSYGSITNNSTVYFSIVSDAPSSSGGSSGGGITFTESSAASVAPAANTGIISNTATRQLVTLPVGSNPDINAVQGKGAGGWQISGNGSLIYLPDGTSDTGLRNNTSTARYASAQLIRISNSSWVVNQSNALTGLQLFTYTSGSYDASSTALFDAVTAAGGSLTTQQKDNIDAVILGFKANSQAKWSKATGIYLFIGTTANTQLINAKSPGTNDLTFTNTGVHDAQGWTTNGTNHSANTGILPYSSHRGLISFSFSALGATNPGVIGGAIASSAVNRFYGGRLATNIFNAIDSTTEVSQSAISATSGSLAICRQNDTEYKTFIDGTLKDTVASVTVTATHDSPIVLGALSNAIVSIVSQKSATYSMITIGENFNDTEIGELASIENTYRLSR
ncbi:MAG: hypothetical protein ACRCZS_16935 [Chroococcidiopsis sp.]